MAARKTKSAISGDRPRRFRSARVDAKVKSILADIESTYGLPHGSVKFVHKDGTTVRSDSSIKTFLDKWDWPY